MRKNISFLVILIAGIFYNCSEDSENDDKLDFSGVAVVDVSNDSSWDYWIVGSRDYYFIKKSPIANFPESVVYHASAINNDFSIFFNENGLVDKVIFDNHIFIFRNFNGHFVDLGVVYPNGETNIFREIETQEYNWDTFTFGRPLSNFDLRSELIRWTGHAIAGIPCALSVAAAIPTGGLSIVGASFTCGLFAARLTGDILESDFNIDNNIDSFLTTYDIAVTGVHCASANAIECIHGITSVSYDLLNWDWQEIDNHENEVRVVEGALNNGYGDIQITLTWDDGADLDLHVIDPYGEEIYYSNPTSTSGGWLDVDDINGYGPENVFWPVNQAPSGNYEVYVHDYDSNGYGPSNYTVLINAFGQTKSYNGSISNNELVHIKNFDENGPSRMINNSKVKLSFPKKNN